MPMRSDARTLCPGLLLAVLAAAGSATAQDRAPASATEAAAAPAAEPAAVPAAQPAAAPAAQQAKPPDGFRVGDFTFKPGGRIKLDIIRDFKPIDNEDSFDTRTIPIDAGDRTNSNLIAKESRLFLDIRGNVDDDELGFQCERPGNLLQERFPRPHYPAQETKRTSTLSNQTQVALNRAGFLQASDR